MPRIELRRCAASLSQNSIGTDALNALLTVPGIRAPTTIDESEDHVVIDYEWDATAAPVDDIAVRLAAFGLERVPQRA